MRAADPLPGPARCSPTCGSIEVDPHDPAAVAEALDAAARRRGQLTDYRRALHERIDEATAELIVRYRENPASALTALPKA